MKQKAVEKGVANHEQTSRMSDREIFNLIFLPGFSTAEKVTNVSGRGVGMDVVKTNIEKIGGSVDLQSEAGKGTTLKIKIPLTLAIIPALIVTSGGERFAIPQVSLLELVRLEAEQARKSIEMLYGAPVYRLRGQLLPLCYLNTELRLETAKAGEAADAVNIVVLQADGRQFGLVVDEINDTEEIVVKPLGKQLKGITCFAGATIMGDGRVALILDVLGVAQRANVIAEVRDRSLTEKNKTETHGDERQTLLLFDAGAGSRMAIPLSMVARLEEFPRAKIETSGARGGRAISRPDSAAHPGFQIHHHVASSRTEPDRHHASRGVFRTRPQRRPGGQQDQRHRAGSHHRQAQRGGQRHSRLGGDSKQSHRSRGRAGDHPPRGPDFLSDHHRFNHIRRATRTSFMSESKQFCTFFVNGLFFGVEVLKVQEVIRFQDMTRVPLTTATIQGLINLRGQIVTAIDLRHRLELPPRAGSELPMNVVVRSDDGAVSLLVDEIGDVVEINDDVYERPPETLRGVARELILGVYKLKERLLLILDTERTVNLSAALAKEQNN